MLLSGNITNTETAFGICSRAATENIVKIMDFPKTVGKTAKTSFPLSRLYEAFSCSPFKTIVFPLKSKNNNAFLKVSVYPKFDHFSKKIIFAFSDRSYCNLSFKKNSKKKF